MPCHGVLLDIDSSDRSLVRAASKLVRYMRGLTEPFPTGSNTLWITKTLVALSIRPRRNVGIQEIISSRKLQSSTV